MKHIKLFENFEDDDVQDNDDVQNDELKLEVISDLISQGYTSGYEPTWTLSINIFEPEIEMDDMSYEYIAKLVKDGFTSGELLIGDENHRGHWSIEIM